MTNAEQRIIHLEQLVGGNLDTISRIQQALNALQQAVRTTQQSAYGGGSGGGGQVYTIAPVVIAGGSSATGVTVYVLIGGASTALPGTYTVYNQMASATVSTAGKTIIVGANGDGSFSVITQSC